MVRSWRWISLWWWRQVRAASVMVVGPLSRCHQRRGGPRSGGGWSHPSRCRLVAATAACVGGGEQASGRPTSRAGCRRSSRCGHLAVAQGAASSDMAPGAVLQGRRATVPQAGRSARTASVGRSPASAGALVGQELATVSAGTIRDRAAGHGAGQHRPGPAVHDPGQAWSGPPACSARPPATSCRDTRSSAAGHDWCRRKRVRRATSGCRRWLGGWAGLSPNCPIASSATAGSPRRHVEAAFEEHPVRRDVIVRYARGTGCRRGVGAGGVFGRDVAAGTREVRPELGRLRTISPCTWRAQHCGDSGAPTPRRRWSPGPNGTDPSAPRRDGRHGHRAWPAPAVASPTRTGWRHGGSNERSRAVCLRSRGRRPAGTPYWHGARKIAAHHHDDARAVQAHWGGARRARGGVGSWLLPRRGRRNSNIRRL